MKRQEAAENCIKWKELHNLWSSSNIFRMIKLRMKKWAWPVTCMREKYDSYKTLFGKPEVARLLGKSHCGWEDSKWILRKQGKRV
jgi:hypothetical protein